VTDLAWLETVHARGAALRHLTYLAAQCDGWWVHVNDRGPVGGGAQAQHEAMAEAAKHEAAAAQPSALVIDAAAAVANFAARIGEG